MEKNQATLIEKVPPKRSSARLTQAERVALSDESMFEAAIGLINERGTHNTLLKEVGEAAGFSRGLAGNRFGSKESLFLSLLNYCEERWRGELEIFLEGRSGLQAYMASLDAVEHFLLEQPKYLKAMYIIWYDSIMSYDQVRAQLDSHFNLHRDEAAGWLETAIEQGTIRADFEVDTFAVISRSFISGTIYQWLVSKETMDIRSAFSLFRDMALGFLVQTPERRD